MTSRLLPTVDDLNRFENMARATLRHMLESGDLPEGTETFDKEKALEQLEALLEKHKGTLVDATTGYGFALLRRISFPEISIAEFREALADIDPAGLAALAEQDADKVGQVKIATIDARRELLEDVMDTAETIVRAALASAMAAALGLS